MREALNQQWRSGLQRYQEIEIPAWQAECAEIDQAWAIVKAAAKGVKRPGKKPPYPPRPKGPIKAKGGSIGGSDLSIVVEGGAEEEVGREVGGEVEKV